MWKLDLRPASHSAALLVRPIYRLCVDMECLEGAISQEASAASAAAANALLSAPTAAPHQLLPVGLAALTRSRAALPNAHSRSAEGALQRMLDVRPEPRGVRRRASGTAVRTLRLVDHRAAERPFRAEREIQTLATVDFPTLLEPTNSALRRDAPCRPGRRGSGASLPSDLQATSKIGA